MALPLCDGNQRTPASIAERHTSSLEEHIACGDGGKHTDELEREAIEEQEGPLPCGEAVALRVRQAEAKKHLLGPVGSRHDFTHWLSEQ